MLRIFLAITLALAPDKDARPVPTPPPATPLPAASSKPDSKPDLDSSDVSEDPRRNYVFVGARYRGTLFPSFILSPFVGEAKSFYFNSIGLEADIRTGGFSFVPAIAYQELGTGDELFADKTRDISLPGNWGIVNSSLRGLYLTADFLWSLRVHKNIDFEYGLGAGVGFLWGDLIINWVYANPNGPYAASDGKRYSQCNTVLEGQGCAIGDHENATAARVGRYSEPSWLSGGGKPSLLPHLSIPQVGLRFKPMRQVQARFGMGLSLTGFWFGLSAHYGLTSP